MSKTIKQAYIINSNSCIIMYNNVNVTVKDNLFSPCNMVTRSSLHKLKLFVVINTLILLGRYKMGAQNEWSLMKYLAGNVLQMLAQLIPFLYTHLHSFLRTKTAVIDTDR